MLLLQVIEQTLPVIYQYFPLLRRKVLEHSSALVSERNIFDLLALSIRVIID
jgi:hypothetical protein